MRLNIFRKLNIYIILAGLISCVNVILASEITLVYKPEDAKSISYTFDLKQGQPLTHELLADLIRKNFKFSEEDLDHTTLGVIYEDDPESDIFVDLEYAGPVEEFASLIAEGSDLTITVMKDVDDDMSDDAAPIDNLITIIYDSPVEEEKCTFVYDVNEYDKLTYYRLHQILREKCNLPQEKLKHCYAGLKINDRDLLPLADLAHNRNSMQAIPDLSPGSVIYVFNWAV